MAAPSALPSACACKCRASLVYLCKVSRSRPRGGLQQKVGEGGVGRGRAEAEGVCGAAREGKGQGLLGSAGSQAQASGSTATRGDREGLRSAGGGAGEVAPAEGAPTPAEKAVWAQQAAGTEGCEREGRQRMRSRARGEKRERVSQSRGRACAALSQQRYRARPAAPRRTGRAAACARGAPARGGPRPSPRLRQGAA